MQAEETSNGSLGGPAAPIPAPAEPQRLGSWDSSSPSRRSPSTASGQLNLAAMQDADSAATCAILLPERYTIKEGSALWGGVKLGRLLGAGVQAKVFELVYADGQPTGKVLKIAHTDLGHKLLNNPIMWIGMEREWEIGTQLRAALEQPGGTLPGFMRMCDCLVRSDDPASGRARFNGMIMEKLNGWEVYKRIDTPEFHNIHYVREMLFQVFSALDRAQRKLGFHHADLGMRNVMEHYSRLWQELEKPAAGTAGSTAGSTGGAGAAAPSGQSLGPGDRCFTCQQPQQRCPAEAEEHYAAVERSGGSMPRTEQQPWWRRSGGSCSRVRPKPGFTCNADGSRLPLGPNVEFKVIDYGVAVFDEQLAQAAGGYESEEVIARLNEIFTARKITFGSKSKKMSLEMETSEGAIPGGPRHTWHLLPTAIRNRFRVKQTPPGATPIPTQQSLEADALQDAAIIRAAAEASAAEQGAGAGGGANGSAAGSGGGGANGTDDEPQRFRSATLLRQPGAGLAKAAELMRASQAVSQDGSGVQPNPQRGASKMPQYKQSPIERMYRRFWQHKGDVFHLLLGMAIVLDDRVWPKEDERDVQLFISLVHHVTGVRMKASFADEGQPGSSGFFGRLACGGMPRIKHDGEARKPALRDYGRWGKWHHWFRRMHIRFQAHWSPYNSGLLAGEALVAPFFGAGRVQHAKLPVCVEQAFPRSAA